MGKKVKAPAPPDYSAVAAASERAAELSFQLGQEQLAWARETYANDQEIIRRVVDDAMQRSARNDADAMADRRRYETIFQPLEEELAADAASFSSEERQRQEMERAQSTVAQNFEAQRRAAIQNLESFGVDPSATRFAALDAGSRVAQAAATAGAGNQARAQTEAIGRALRSEAINVGRGYPGQVAGTYATALQSGNQAANSQLGGTASGASTMGTGTQWMGVGNQAINTWGNSLNAGYQNQLAAADFNSRQSSGLGGLAAFFEDGGMATEALPGVTSGGSVPAVASPSRGAAIDDVTAKINVGEFVVPTDVVSWKGEEFFQRLIEKSRQEKPRAPAKPSVAHAPASVPTFASRPAAAIPMVA